MSATQVLFPVYTDILSCFSIVNECVKILRYLIFQISYHKILIHQSISGCHILVFCDHSHADNLSQYCHTFCKFHFSCHTLPILLFLLSPSFGACSKAMFEKLVVIASASICTPTVGIPTNL